VEERHVATMKFFLPAAVLAAAMSRVSAQTASLATQTVRRRLRRAPETR
jgi:hypothetical protein